MVVGRWVRLWCTLGSSGGIGAVLCSGDGVLAKAVQQVGGTTAEVVCGLL